MFNSAISHSKKRMGKLKFSSLRKTYDRLSNGLDVPKHDYSFRIDPGKLSHALSFLQTSLEMKPGTLRNVHVAGHLFKDMHVYDRGEHSFEYLLNTYINAYPNVDERVGKHTFHDLIKLMTKCGEAKAGLSTYYIRFRNASKIFVEMMDRLKILTEGLSEKNQQYHFEVERH